MAIELRRGLAHRITTRAEYNRGQGWCSVAYFDLDDQPTRLVCEALAPYSRSALPPAFEEGDELIVIGKIGKNSPRFDASCGRVMRQGVIFDQNNTTTIIFGGLWIFALGFYPVAQIIRSASTVKIEEIAQAVTQHNAVVPLFFMTLPASLTGIILFIVGIGQVKARRMLNAAARSAS